MDSKDQATPPPLSDPPSLDDSQMDDALQEVSSQSSSQMPELEQMEGGPEQIVEEDSTSQSAPDVEAMEVEDTPEMNPPPPSQIVIIEEQIPAATDDMTEAVSTESTEQVVVVEKQAIEGGQVHEVVAPAANVTAATAAEVVAADEQVGEGMQDVQGEEQEEQDASEVLQQNIQGQHEEHDNQVVSEEVQEEGLETKDVISGEPSTKKTEAADETATKATEKDKEQKQPEDETKAGGEPAQKKVKLDPSATKESAKGSSQKPDTKIVLTLAPGASPKKKGQAPEKPDSEQREVTLSFNMQEMLAATDDGKDGEDSPPKTLPMNVQVGTPKTRQATKRGASKDSAASTEKTAKQESIGTPKTEKSAEDAQADDSALRRSSRRKSSTPKWRPKDLLESESEEEEEEDEEEDKEQKEGKKETVTAKPVTRKRGRPSTKSAGDTPPVTQKAATPLQKGRKMKIKTEPPDKPVKIKQEPDPDWYGGRPKSIWIKKEERALVRYVIDWQKQGPAQDEEEDEEEEEDEPDDGKMSSKQFDEMNLMIPEQKNDKDWKDCADFVSKANQKPIRSVKSCYQFALTIQECMTNEGAMEHYDFDEDKIKSNYQSAIFKKPLRGKPAGEKTLWTDEEEQALVVFILHWQLKQKTKMVRSKPAKTRRKARIAPSVDETTKGDFRIMPIKSELWDDCAKFISRKTCLPKRTGAACRSYAVGIQKKYTKEEAIEEFEIGSDYDSDVEAIPAETKSTSYDKYMQDDSFIFNLWLSEMGKLTSYQEEHVLHRLLLKKINRGEFKCHDFMYYFKHLPKDDQKETADLLVAHGHGTEQANGTEVEGESNKKAPSALVTKYKQFASEKQRSMDSFSRQMDVNLHYTEKQMKNMREILNKTQAENKYLLEKMKTMKEVIARITNTQSKAKQTAWSLDMDLELNIFRKKNLFQWLLINGYIPRMPKEDIMIPKGLFYCIFTAIEQLEEQNRPNSVFHLAKALCLRKTNGERVMSANRMPFALLEANIMFFGGKGYNFLQQEGYKRWVETQYAWFGEVWFSLFGGPNMKSMAGEEPKPLGSLDGDFEDVKNVKSENGTEESESDSTMTTENTKDGKKYSLTLCPEDFSPPEGATEYLKVGERWGKLTLLTPVQGVEGGYTSVDASKSTEDNQDQQGTRKSARRQAKASPELEDNAAEEDTVSKTPAPSTQSSTPGSVKRRGKTASVAHRPSKMLKTEPGTSQDTEEVDKILQGAYDGDLSEFDVWTNPPDFSFEDDFTVPENSDLNKVRLNVVSATPRSIQRRAWEREPIIQPSAEIKVRLNVVSGTPRAVRRRAIEKEHIIEPDASVKEDMLQQLKRVNPDGKWWLKTGWCDITANKALRVTGKLEFTGDEDLGDGALFEAQEQFRDRLKKTRSIGVGTRKNESALREDLFQQIADLQDDHAQLCEGLRRIRATKGIYKSKMGVPERAAVDEGVDREIASYVKLLERNQDLRIRVERALSQGGKARVITLRNDMAEYQTNYTIRMRTIANYVLIFMISDDLQGANPFSWPVRVVPVNAITRELVETLRDQLVEAMCKENMHIVGIIRDELTPHLSMGSPNRPVCITQLMDEARTEVSTFHPSEMEKYFTVVTLYSRSGDLKLTPQWRHGAVPEEDVVWVYNYMNSQNVSFLEALQALHKEQFPVGYTPYPFKTATRYQNLESEMLEDQLRALMAVYIFRHKIKTYQAEGVDFENYLYVPAVHPLTQQKLHVRDSVTKLLRSISRQAKDDRDLTIEKKERLSNALDSWFKAAINTWWTPEMRREGNQALLSFVLEEWLPYATPDDRNYSAIDVNRPVSKVCFLSEDLLVSLVINIESENQCPCLHPWAATCQDVNTFVHLIKNPGQRQNDSRQIMHPQIIKKLSVEFAKAIDPTLEFYYYWGDHEKTLYNILLNLNDPRTKRSATGPKYRKKPIGIQGLKKGAMIKEEVMIVEEEEEHSKDATEDDEEEMDMSINAEEESTSSTPSKMVVELQPIPVALNQVVMDAQQEQATIVTVTAPGPSVAIGQASGSGVVQQASTEDIIAAELLRQIEASLQAGVAVVTVTESSHGESVTVTESSQPVSVTVTESSQHVAVTESSQSVYVTESSQPVYVTENSQPVYVTENSQPVYVTESSQPVYVAESSQPVYVTESSQPIVVTESSQPIIVTESSQPIVVTESSQPIIVTESSQPIVVTESAQPVVVTQSSQPIVVTENAQPVVVSQSSQPVVVTQSSQPIVVTESAQPVVVTQSSQPVVTQSSQSVVVAQSSQPVVAESSQTIVVTESSQPVVATESSQLIVTESSQPVVAESSQPIVVTESSQPVVVTESSQLIVTESSQPIVVTESSHPVVVAESSELVVVTGSLQPQ